MKFRLVEDFDDLLLEVRKPVIEPSSELEKNLIYDIEHTDKSYEQIGKEYGLNGQMIARLAQRKNLRAKQQLRLQKMHVYFNTLKADIHSVSKRIVEANMKFLPSIYLGEYSVGSIESMYEYIRKKYLGTRISTKDLIEFYLKIASDEISLNTLITEMKAQSTNKSNPHSATFDHKFITASTVKLPTVDFNSVNYPQLAKDILIFLGRKSPSSNDFDSHYKDLKATAAKLDPKTDDRINRIDTYISDNLEKIARNIYSKKGDIIEPTNYINGIPYETSFDVNSPQDIASCIKQYKGYLLYGFMDKTGDIVYIGISVAARSRASLYDNENRPMIIKAFEDNIIKKLIIFKSNLPIESRSTNTSLIYALEVYFAEQLFNTYPENYPKALNKAKPGQNSSGLLTAQNRDDFELYISDQDRLLSAEEFTLAGEKVLNVGNSQIRKLYPYYEYAEDYISKHNGNLSVKDKQTLYKSLSSDTKHILWDICASESEYKEIMGYNNSLGRSAFYNWKNYRIKNNLPITEELDDDIDMEYYV